MASNERDLTEGNTLKNLWMLAWPGIAGRFFENLYQLVNIKLIGMLGAVAGTLGQSAIVTYGIVAGFFGILNNISGPGSVTVISRNWGAKNYIKAAWAAEQTLIYKFLAGVIAAIIGLTFLKWLLALAGADTIIRSLPANTLPTAGELPFCKPEMTLAIQYGTIQLIALPFQFCYFTYNTIFRCTSDSETGMILNISSAIINIVLDIIFILGWGIIPKMGIVGVALATVISQMIAFFVGMYFLLSGNKITLTRFSLLAFPKIVNSIVHYRLRIPYYKIRLDKRGIKISFAGLFKPDLGILKTFLRIGTSYAATNSLGSVSSMITINIISVFGPAYKAVFGVIGTIAGFVNMPLLGLQQAAGALVGQNLGAKKPEGAAKTTFYAMLMGIGICFLTVIVGFPFGGWIVGQFQQNPESIKIGALVFGLAMTGNMINAGQWMLWTAFEGSGYTFLPSLFGQLNHWLFNILPVFLAIKVFKAEVQWIYYIGIFASMSVFTINWTLFRKGAWKSARI
jgi:Na+-driven multidrug efflux pump